MAENVRQFASLDYANADLYAGVLERPSPAVPVNIPLGSLKPVDGLAKDPLDQALRRQESQRTNELFNQQREAQAARESALREREIARNQRLQEMQSKPYESPSTVKDRQYEQLYEPPKTSNRPQPSTGSPPPTPNLSPARPSALVEPTATPAPVGLKEALPLASLPLQRALPRSLPQAAGRLAVPGVAVGLDLTGRLLAGQPLGQAVSGAAGGAIGGGIGALAGNAIVPGLGGVVGFMIGGMVGGLISDWLFGSLASNDAQHYQTPINYPPYRGGAISHIWNAYFTNDSGTRQADLQSSQYTSRTVIGTVTAVKFINFYQYDAGSPEGNYGWVNYKISYIDINGNNQEKTVSSDNVPVKYGQPRLLGFLPVGTPPSVPTDPQGYKTPPPDNRPGFYDDPPINRNSTIPSGVPSNGTKGKINEVAPSRPPGNTPRNDNPDWVPSGHLMPRRSASPDQMPGNLGANLPSAEPVPTPNPYTDPGAIAAPAPRPGLTVTPSTGGVVEPQLVPLVPATITPATIGYAEGTDADGNYISPNGKVTPANDSGMGTNEANNPVGGKPSPLPQPQPRAVPPDATSSTPKAQAAPVPKTPEQTSNDEFLKKIDDKLARLGGMAATIAALTPIINNIPNAIAKNPNVRAANRDDVQGAVCEIAQPGGCLGAPIKQAEDAAKANGNKLDELNAALGAGNAGANAAQLALLNTINTKLGDQLPGGISAKLERLAKWLHLDRALNILIWWQTLHNAYMLSGNLGQTLTSAISNVLAAIGIKDAENSPLDIGQILGGQFDSLAKTVIGESEWGGIKAEYKKWNRIYQAAANLMYSIQSIGASILNALEVVGSWVALIGNGLRKWGEISEVAYRWMNPQINFQNKYFTALENVENVVSQLDVVASEILSVQDTVTQIKDQKREIDNSLKQVDDSKQRTQPPAEAEKIKQQEADSKTASVGADLSESDKEADEDNN